MAGESASAAPVQPLSQRRDFAQASSYSRNLGKAERRAAGQPDKVSDRKPAHPAHDAQATTNPVVVLEVLSPSSAGDDDGDKRRDFQSLASLEAYVLAAQDARCVKFYVAPNAAHGAMNQTPTVTAKASSYPG
jgi:Uma2 family endonuclease